MKKVLILFGGKSPEYEVSLESAYAVISNMSAGKYESILVGITKEGKWFRYYGDRQRIPADTWHRDGDNCVPAVLSPNWGERIILEYGSWGIKRTEFDIAFPILHGKNGEDGTLQGLLELAGIPFVGCNTLSSALCMDKDRAHKLVKQAGIKTPKGLVFSMDDKMDNIIEASDCLSYPLFVKPIKAGSSFGITKVYEVGGLRKAIEDAFLHDNQIIIEEEVPGFEVGCAILGNHEFIVGEIDEIELSGGFFDYVEKYNLKSSKIHMPARISPEKAEGIKKVAMAVYSILGCSGFARVDMFLTPKGEIVFNEVNTIPGFTLHSRYPNMMKGIGMEYGDVIDRLIRLGLER